MNHTWIVALFNSSIARLAVTLLVFGLRAYIA